MYFLRAFRQIYWLCSRNKINHLQNFILPQGASTNKWGTLLWSDRNSDYITYYHIKNCRLKRSLQRRLLQEELAQCDNKVKLKEEISWVYRHRRFRWLTISASVSNPFSTPKIVRRKESSKFKSTRKKVTKKQKLEHLIQFKNCSPSERSQNFPKETKLPRSQLYKDSRNIEKIMKFPHRLLSARKIFTDPNDYRSTGLFPEAQAAVMTKYRHLRSCGLRVTVKWLRTSMKLYCDTVKPMHKFKNGNYPFTKTWKNSKN